MVRNFPLLVIPVAIYNVMALGGGVLSRSAQEVVEGLARILFTVPMASNTQWIVTSGDVVLLIALLALFTEFLKAARHGREAMFNHTLSLAIFIICLVEFLLIPAFASTLFFIIMVMALLDVLAGFMITVMSAQHENIIEEEYTD